MVLLHLLRFPLSSWSGELYAAHFDHRMRPGSDLDARWVRGVCRAWETRIVVGRALRPAAGEAEAREWRYGFLRQAARRLGAERVLTAHHADDQVETVLFRIHRGAGVRGLMGIPPRRGRLVRPLLPFRRSELVRYADEVGLSYREDPSNRSLRFTRNRIRHVLLPALIAVEPEVETGLLRVAEEARRLVDTWEAVLGEARKRVVLRQDTAVVELARSRLLSYDLQVRAQLLRHAVRRLGGSLSRRGTGVALEFTSRAASGRGIDLGGGLRLEREWDLLRIAAPAMPGAVPQDREAVIPSAAPAHAEAVLGGHRYVVYWGEHAPVATWSERFDASALTFPLALRAWRPGDRIRLAGGTKKLKKVFAEHRIGRARRARTPVLVDALGRVLWVVGLAAARGTSAASPGSRTLDISVVDGGHA